MSTYADLLAPANDLAGLRSLVMGLSANAASAAEATSGNAILYSGMLDSHHSSQVARAIAAEQNLAIIDNTPRGALMMSGDFEDALKRVVTAEFANYGDSLPIAPIS